MIKINGRTFLERDFVGEFPLDFGDTRTIKRACDKFFQKRGIRTATYDEMANAECRAMRARNKRRNRK